MKGLFPEEHEFEISFLKKMIHLIVINNFYKQIRENLDKFQTKFKQKTISNKKLYIHNNSKILWKNST